MHGFAQLKCPPIIETIKDQIYTLKILPYSNDIHLVYPFYKLNVCYGLEPLAAPRRDSQEVRADGTAIYSPSNRILGL